MERARETIEEIEEIKRTEMSSMMYRPGSLNDSGIGDANAAGKYCLGEHGKKWILGKEERLKKATRAVPKVLPPIFLKIEKWS